MRWLPGLLLTLFLAGCQLLGVGAGAAPPPATLYPTAAPGLASATANITALSPAGSTSLAATTLPPAVATAATPAVAVPAATDAGPERTIIGYSVQGRPLEAIRLGNGPNWYILVGAIHGGTECHTGALVESLLTRAEAELVEPSVTLYFLPWINPDGCVLDSRRNANGVDLNRNWQTADWLTNAEGPGGPVWGSGGPHPFSEPETVALRDWLLGLRQQPHQEPIRLIAYHAAVPETGLVQPGSGEQGQPTRTTEALAQAYARTALYRYSAEWVGAYTITGEFAHWATNNGFVAIDVELPDHGLPDMVPAGWRDSHLETNLRALKAILR
jgi:hypothetical protein